MSALAQWMEIAGLNLRVLQITCTCNAKLVNYKNTGLLKSTVPWPLNNDSQNRQKKKKKNRTILFEKVRATHIIRQHSYAFSPSISILSVQFLGSRDGTVVRTLAYHQCGPCSIPGLSVIIGLSLLLVLIPAPRGFPLGSPVFLPPQKPTFPNSYST